MSANGQSIIFLVSTRTGTAFKVTRQAASISAFVANALEQDPTLTEVKVDLDNDVLDAISTYMIRHNGAEAQLIEKPLRTRILHEACPDLADAVFMDNLYMNDMQLLYDVAMGALYLHIPGLLHLSASKIASLIKGHPLDKIKDILVPRRSA